VLLAAVGNKSFTRYSVMTGEYAWRQKARKTSILDGDAPLAIEPGRLTLPAMLRQQGYKTGVVGKWHLGFGDGQTPVDFNGEIKPGPLEIGFDYCHIIPATVDRVPCVWIENRGVVNLDPADSIRVSYVTNWSSRAARGCRSLPAGRGGSSPASRTRCSD